MAKAAVATQSVDFEAIDRLEQKLKLLVTVLERTRRVARTYRTPIALVLAYLVMRGLLLFWRA